MLKEYRKTENIRFLYNLAMIQTVIMKKIILFFTLILGTLLGHAQKTPVANRITITANNIPDTTVYLARYFGPKLYYADTANVVNGKFQFDGSKQTGGLYAVVMPNGKYFEIIIDNEEVIIHIKDLDDLIGSLEVKKSESNITFYKYINYMTESRKLSDTLSKQYKAALNDSPEQVNLKNKLEALNVDVKSFQKGVVEKNKDKFIGQMINMSLDVELPDSPRDENGTITDSNYVFFYYENHYWDNVNLKDARIVGTPIFHNKLDRYFSQKGVLQVPDTIAKYAIKLLDKTDQVDQDNKVFQYIVHHVTNKYETSKIMGLDNVFAIMADTYYCGENSKAYWVTEENKKKICERAEKIGRTAIGNYSVPLILPDSTEKNWINSYRSAADYTVLYFWDPNCGHCKKVTPKLQTLYDAKFKARNIDIYAVGKATGDEFDKWKDFIKTHKLTFTNVGLTKTIYNQALEDPYPLLKYTTAQSLNYADTYDVYSTPRIFILDKEKRIIYKQISVGQLEEILDKLTGHESDEKLFPVEDPENGESAPHTDENEKHDH